MRTTDGGEALAKAEERLVKAALDERAAEQACRNRPWTDRSSWIAYIDAVMARREAVDALIRASGR